MAVKRRNLAIVTDDGLSPIGPPPALDLRALEEVMGDLVFEFRPCSGTIDALYGVGIRGAKVVLNSALKATPEKLYKVVTSIVGHHVTCRALVAMADRLT